VSRAAVSLRSLLRTRPLLVVLLGLPLLWVTVVVSGLYLALGRLAISWAPGPDVWILGRDFSVFYVGGSLAREGSWSVLYDVAAFAARFDEVTGLDLPAGGPLFRYPPPTAFAYVPLSATSLGVALVLWTLAGVAAYVASVRLLRLSPTAGILVFASVPAYGAVALGQNTFFAFLVLALAGVAARRGAPIWLGVLIGLLVLKPQLALGPALWWLSAPSRHRRELMGALVSGGSSVLATVLATPQGWATYLERLPTLADPGPTNRVWYFSGLDFFRMVFGEGGAATLAWAAVTLTVVAGFVVVFRRVADDPTTALAWSIVATMLITPHMVVYDWLLLAVAGALLWDRVPRWSLLTAAVLLHVVALYGPDIASWQAERFTTILHPAYPLLLALATPVLIRTARRPGDHPRPSRSST